MGYKGNSYLDSGYILSPDDETDRSINDIEHRIERTLTLKEMNDLFELTNSDEVNEWIKGVSNV